MPPIYILYFVVVNIVTFLFMGLDKYQAKKHNPRISEMTFMSLSALGGFIGIILGAKVYRHKTLKRSFQLKVLLGIIVFIAAVYILFTK